MEGIRLVMSANDISPLNMDLREYLGQGDVWIVANSPAIPIESMDEDHKRKAARWLMSRAQAFITIVECSTNEGITSGESKNPEADLRAVLSLVAQDPRGWLRTTPLFQALVKDLPVRSEVIL
jgi:hypothetical protein